MRGWVELLQSLSRVVSSEDDSVVFFVVIPIFNELQIADQEAYTVLKTVSTCR